MGRAGAVAVAGTLNITSNVLPAAIKTSVWTRGAAGTVAAPATCTPGTVLPSSAIKVNPLTGIREARQNCAGDSGGDGGSSPARNASVCRKHRSRRTGLTERAPVDEVIEGRVIDSGGVTSPPSGTGWRETSQSRSSGCASGDCDGRRRDISAASIGNCDGID